MKLAVVQHERCGEQEWGAGTYVWVSEDMSEEELYRLACLAQESYLKAEAELKRTLTPQNPGYQPNFSAYPDKSVREVQAIHAKQKQAWQEYEKRRDKARQPFSKHLVRVSAGAIKGFYDVEPSLSVEVSWGHRHGTVIDYGTTKGLDEGGEEKV